MSPTSRSARDTWIDFAAAVDFVADVEEPGLTVWRALAEALLEWMGEQVSCVTTGDGHADPLREGLRRVLDAAPEVGAPGGVEVGVMLEAAMADWMLAAASRVNDCLPFVG